jgi:large subunit ribosomal protein L28
MASNRNLSSKITRYGRNKSHSQKRTPRLFKPNLQTASIYSPELGRTVKIRVCAKDIRTIDKIGLEAFLEQQGRSLRDVRGF